MYPNVKVIWKQKSNCANMSIYFGKGVSTREGLSVLILSYMYKTNKWTVECESKFLTLTVIS